MFHYELHQLRSAELIQRADRYRLAREAVRTTTAARRSAGNEAEGRVSEQPGRSRSPLRSRRATA
ncbi:hypothetical protein [Streptomyces sp. H27-D2]|uniref:hypothetical protein n=1 Tax=Streptomyces sp. H27-D2 TaxID=3046304 RepID=UPI002DBFCD92|nr:hypothetical protein [Streptomyces sp. H27-D2]MEC4016239.1 hypothetical protein [Streptomyces sp. H27-D2]